VIDRDATRYRLVTGRLTAGGIELHVLARAYRAAWIALHLEPPVGWHRLADLGLAIDFGEPRPKPAHRRRAARRRKPRMTRT
jgi:hypothetical protein